MLVSANGWRRLFSAHQCSAVWKNVIQLGSLFSPLVVVFLLHLWSYCAMELVKMWIHIPTYICIEFNIMCFLWTMRFRWFSRIHMMTQNHHNNKEILVSLFRIIYNRLNLRWKMNIFDNVNSYVGFVDIKQNQQTVRSIRKRL